MKYVIIGSNDPGTDLIDIVTERISKTIDKYWEYYSSVKQPVADEIYKSVKSQQENLLNEMIWTGTPSEVAAAFAGLDYLQNQGGYQNLRANVDMLADISVDFITSTYFDSDRSAFDTTNLVPGGYTPIVPPGLESTGVWNFDPVVRLRNFGFILDNIADPEELFANPNLWIAKVGLNAEYTISTENRVKLSLLYEFAEQYKHIDDTIAVAMELEFFNHRGMKFSAKPFFEVEASSGDLDSAGIMFQLKITPN